MSRIEKTFYLVTALWSLPGWFMHPVYPMFLMSRGLDLFEINAILAIFQISVFLFDVPTGALADVHGRKRAFLASCATRMAAFLLYSVASGFAFCAVAEVIDALGLTLASGALEAWAVDALRAEKDPPPVERLFARSQMVVRGAVIVGGIACGYIADRFGLRVPWLVAAGMFAVAAMVGWTLMADDRLERATGDGGRRAPLIAASMRALGAVRRHAVMRTICALTILVAFALMPVVMMWPPRLTELTGEGYWLLGWVWALLSTAAVLGSWLVGALLRHMRREILLCGLALWQCALLSGAALATTFHPMLGCLLLYEVALAAREPVMAAWMNEHIAPELRATMLSVKGMSFTFGGAVGLVCLGLVARGHGIAAAWLGSAAVYLLLAPGSLLLGRIARREAAPRQARAAEVA
jgi:MFS family permease